MTRPAALAVLLVALLYALLPATVYRGDGMAYAAAIAASDGDAVNPNHLLYGVVGSGALRLTRFAGLHVEPIRLLQHLGVVTAALALLVFHSLLLALGVDRSSSLGFTLCLAFSSGFWLQAISPETFGLSILLALLALRAAAAFLRGPTIGNAVRLGAACGLAALGSVVDLLLIPGVAWLLARAAPRARWKTLGAAAGSLAAVVVTGFLAAALYRGIAVADLLPWALGRASEPAWIGFQAVNPLRDVRNLAANLLPQISILLDLAAGEITIRTVSYGVLAAGVGLTLLWIAVQILRARRPRTTQDRVMIACLACYLIGLIAFFTVWVNYSTEFWATHWMPLWAILAIALKPVAAGRPAVRAAVHGTAAALGLLGLAFLAVPLHDSPEGELASCLRQRVGKGDLIVVTWLEKLDRPGARLLHHDLSPLRRSTFAVNLDSYVSSPVHHLGCWELGDGVRCFQDQDAATLVADVRGRLDGGGRAWLLEISDRRPGAGTTAGDTLGRVLDQFDVSRVSEACGDAMFAGVILREMAPPPEY